MGVDYSAHYGLGYEIVEIDFEDDSLSQDIRDLECMDDFLFEKLESDIYAYFQVGEGAYCGNTNQFFVKVLNPFNNGITGLASKSLMLKAYLERIGIETKGDFGLIGGLEIH